MVTESELRYWFPAKRYGWGWGPPVTWQGWAVLLVWLAAFFSGVRYFAYRHGLLHIAFAGAMVLVLLVICYLKGEPPRWRWGK
jgi:hypothetical protein